MSPGATAILSEIHRLCRKMQALSAARQDASPDAMRTVPHLIGDAVRVRHLRRQQHETQTLWQCMSEATGIVRRHTDALAGMQRDLRTHQQRPPAGDAADVDVDDWTYEQSLTDRLANAIERTLH